MGSGVFIEGEDGIGYLIYVVTSEFGINRQAENALREAFANGELARAMPELAADFHKMNRHRVMDSRTDAGLFEVRAQFVAFIGLDNECVINAPFPGAVYRALNA